MIPKKTVVSREEVSPEKRMVKLRHNFIKDGQMYNKGSIIDENLLPEHLRSDEHVTWDLDPMDGKVMILHNMIFGGNHAPIYFEMGDLVRLIDVPERDREGWIEGKDYSSNWTEADRARLRAKADAEYERNVFGKDLAGDVHVGPGGW